MRISDWSSDVCSSDLLGAGFHVVFGGNLGKAQALPAVIAAAERLQGDPDMRIWLFGSGALFGWLKRSEEHTSELQSLMRISYAVFCLKINKYLLTSYYVPVPCQYQLTHKNTVLPSLIILDYRHSS